MQPTDPTHVTKPSITAAALLREVIKLALLEPDFVYRGDKADDDKHGNGACWYAPINAQGRRCIVGQALFNLGVPDEAMQAQGDKIASIPRSVLSSWGVIRNDVDRELFFALNAIQRRQDGGRPWGTCINGIMIPSLD